MKKFLSILLLSSLIFGACAKMPEKESGKIRFIFDPGDLKFISSSFNPGQQTISALYGNQQAVSLLSGYSKRQPGSFFKLVTYQIQDDPNYFGSKVNGPLLRIEAVTVNPEGNLEYGLEFGKMPSGQSKDQRVAIVLDQEPVKFPK